MKEKIQQQFDRFNPKKMHRTRKQRIWKKIMIGLWILNFLLLGCVFYRLSVIESLIK